MDPNAKKTALRMIPYGLYVLTAKDGDDVAAATVNWVTQASFAPPLVVVGVKADSHAHAVIKKTKAFALNVLGKGQQQSQHAFDLAAEAWDESALRQFLLDHGVVDPKGPREQLVQRAKHIYRECLRQIGSASAYVAQATADVGFFILLYCFSVYEMFLGGPQSC